MIERHTNAINTEHEGETTCSGVSIEEVRGCASRCACNVRFRSIYVCADFVLCASESVRIEAGDGRSIF